MSSLAWVFTPTVSDGHVAYRYRNSGTETVAVDEDVSAFTHDSLDAGVQHFALPALAPEHVYHSPSAADGSWQAHLPIAADEHGTVAPTAAWTVDLSDL